MLPFTYDMVIIGSAVTLAALASSRFGWVFGGRWGMNGDPRGFFSLACAAAAAVVMFFVSTAALQGGGIPFGIISVRLAIPTVGFAWIFIVGGNKALERILSGLLKKLS